MLFQWSWLFPCVPLLLIVQLWTLFSLSRLRCTTKMKSQLYTSHWTLCLCLQSWGHECSFTSYCYFNDISAERIIHRLYRGRVSGGVISFSFYFFYSCTSTDVEVLGYSTYCNQTLSSNQTFRTNLTSCFPRWVWFSTAGLWSQPSQATRMWPGKLPPMRVWWLWRGGTRLTSNWSGGT